MTVALGPSYDLIHNSVWPDTLYFFSAYHNKGWAAHLIALSSRHGLMKIDVNVLKKLLERIMFWKNKNSFKPDLYWLHIMHQYTIKH